MSFYEFLVLIHVLAAIVWVGGTIAFEIRGTRAMMTGDNRAVLGVLADGEWQGKFVFMPASIIVLIFGVWAVLDHPVWEFSDTWVTIGFTALIVSAILGGAFLGPEAARIREAADAGGPDDAGVQQKLKRFVMLSRIDLLIVLIAVWAMVTKPGA